MVMLTLTPRKRDPEATPRYARLGARIKEGRRVLRLSGRETAERVGIKYGTWNNIESGWSRPKDLEQLRHIAVRLDLDVEELAHLAGFTLYKPQGGISIPTKPGYDAILTRMQELFSPEELSSLERAGVAMFLGVKRTAQDEAEHGGQADGAEDRPESEPNR